MILVSASTGPDRAARHTLLLVEAAVATGRRPLVVAWQRGPLDALLPAAVPRLHPSDRADGLAGVARRLPLPPRVRAVDRARSLQVRALLLRHHRERVVLDGAAAGVALPWLRHHRGEVVWVVHAGEAVPPGVDVRGIDRLVLGPGVAPPPPGRGPAVERAEAEVPDVAPGRPLRLASAGPLDAHGGTDLLPRLLWELDRGAAPGAVVTWLAAGPDPALPRGCRDDLRRLGLGDRVRVAGGGGPDLPDLPAADALVLLHRGAPPDPALVATAAGLGIPTVAFGPATPFPDLAALAGEVAARARDTSARRALAAAAATGAHAALTRPLLAP